MLVLIHSPIAGPVTWQLVAEALRARGIQVGVPDLNSPEIPERPYWHQHADAVARALAAQPAGEQLILVAHSGAGLLLPAVRQALGRPVAGYVFVDAGIPQDHKSRLQLLGEELGEDFALQLGQQLADGQRWPSWTEDDLREEVPDNDLRHRLIAQLHPQPARFFEEPIPVFRGWPDALCAYLQFTPGYRPQAALARQRGWPSRHLAGGHFHMLVDPGAVADALSALSAEMKIAL